MPLSRTCFAYQQLAVFDDSYLDPFPDQAEHAAVSYALLYHLYESGPNNFVEGPYDTLPTTRTFRSMSPSLAHNIRWKEKNWPSLDSGVTRANYI